MNLTLALEALHKRAIARGIEYKKCEWSILQDLQQIEKTKLDKKTGCASVFDYSVKYMDLDPSNAYPLIKAARMARDIPRLAKSFSEKRLTVGKASRIFSVLNPGNADQIVEFAETHTAKEINLEVGRIREKMGLPSKFKSVKLTEDTVNKAKRLRSIWKSADLDQTIGRAIHESLDRHDPVRKAERAMKRKAQNAKAANESPSPDEKNRNSHSHSNEESTPEETSSAQKFTCSWTNSVHTEKSGRIPFRAEEKHEVFARCGGQCAHIDLQGRRCTNDRYLHIHHIKPVSQGGTNEPGNLTLLCPAHHDLAHQLTLPLEGQFTFFR